MIRRRAVKRSAPGGTSPCQPLHTIVNPRRIKKPFPAMSNGSGDYALAFATAEAVRRTQARRGAATTIEDLPNDKISPLFQAVAEATEEAVYNAMLQATSTTGVDDHRLEALPLDRLKEILARYGIGTPTK
jgi:D-aminopeptidase